MRRREALIAIVRVVSGVAVLVLGKILLRGNAIDAPLVACCFIAGFMLGVLGTGLDRSRSRDRRELVFRVHSHDAEPLPAGAVLASTTQTLRDAFVHGAAALTTVAFAGVVLELVLIVVVPAGLLVGMGAAGARNAWRVFQREDFEGVRYYREIGADGRWFSQPR